MDTKKSSGCVISTGSMNRAIQARNLLTSAAIFSKVVKLDGKAARGCAYGVSLPCSESRAALDLLRRAGVRGTLVSVPK